MSWTNILSAGTAVPSVGASEPTGLGTLNVPSRAQLSCQVCFDATRHVRGVAECGCVGVRAWRLPVCVSVTSDSV